MSYDRELVAIIRKMVTDQRDLEFLPQMALMACNEIERLDKQLTMRNQLGKNFGNPWK